MSERRRRRSGLALVCAPAAVLLGGGALFAEYGPRLDFGNGWLSDLGQAVLAVVAVTVAFGLGLYFRRVVGLAGIVWMAVTVELTNGYANPFVLVLAFGPWLVGLMVRERRHLAEQLALSALRLEAENQLLAEESVRCERARIARELHDIVAHCVSVMVVQAYAGERLAARDEASASEAFDHIAEAAGRAQLEIGHLVDLLASGPTHDPERGLTAGVGELLAGAVATGLSVNLRVHGDTDRLAKETSGVAYRVIQESITNALKHAPGAPIDITVDCDGDGVAIKVMNGMSPQAGWSLARSGGGHGLDGMRQRVESIDGDFHAGTERDGTWSVCVHLPASPLQTGPTRLLLAHDGIAPLAGG